MRKGQQTVEVIPLFPTDDDVIVEWRAVTVGFLDELLVEVNSILGLRGTDQLTLAQMLEAGSWKVIGLVASSSTSILLTSSRAVENWRRFQDQTPKNLPF